MSALSRMSGQQCELPVTPRIKLQAEERQAANNAECRVEHRAKRQTASLEPSAKPPWPSSILSRALSHQVLSQALSCRVYRAQS